MQVRGQDVLDRIIDGVRNVCRVTLDRAERRLGEMLAGTEKSDGGRPSKTGNIMLPVSTLSDFGLTKMESSRFQAEARVPPTWRS